MGKASSLNLAIVTILTFLSSPQSFAALSVEGIDHVDPLVEERIRKCKSVPAEASDCLQDLMHTYDQARLDPWISFNAGLSADTRAVIAENCDHARRRGDLAFLDCIIKGIKESRANAKADLLAQARQLRFFAAAWSRTAYECWQIRGKPANTSICGSPSALPLPGSNAPSGSQQSMTGDDTHSHGTLECSDLTYADKQRLQSTANADAIACRLEATDFMPDIRQLYAHLSKEDYFSLLKIRLSQIQGEAYLDGLAMAGQCEALDSPKTPHSCSEHLPGVKSFLKSRSGQRSKTCHEMRQAPTALLANHQLLASERKDLRCRRDALQTLQKCCDGECPLPSRENANFPFDASCSPESIRNELSRFKHAFDSSGVHSKSVFGPEACPSNREVKEFDANYEKFDLEHPVFGQQPALESALLKNGKDDAKLLTLRKSYRQLSQSVEKDLALTCDPAFEARDLIGERAIADAVLKAAPEFSGVDRCFADHYSRRDKMFASARSVLQACSIIGLIPTAPTFALGAACATGDLSLDSTHYLAARSWASLAQELSTTVGSRVVTTDELAQVRETQALLGDIKSDAANLAMMTVLTAAAKTPEILKAVQSRLRKAANAGTEIEKIERELLDAHGATRRNFASKVEGAPADEVGLPKAHAEPAAGIHPLAESAPPEIAANAGHLTAPELQAVKERLKAINAITDETVRKAALRELSEEIEAQAIPRKYNLEGVPAQERASVQRTLADLERNGVSREKLLEEFPCLK